MTYGQWSEAELGRVKQLRREGYTYATVAGFLRKEFGTACTGPTIQKLIAALRGKGLVVETREDHEKQAARQKRAAAELAVANAVRRRCLSCSRGFDSEGAGNRICAGCKQSEAWR
jgi:hypothetical protein